MFPLSIAPQSKMKFFWGVYEQNLKSENKMEEWAKEKCVSYPFIPDIWFLFPSYR